MHGRSLDDISLLNQSTLKGHELVSRKGKKPYNELLEDLTTLTEELDFFFQEELKEFQYQ